MANTVEGSKRLPGAPPITSALGLFWQRLQCGGGVERARPVSSSGLDVRSWPNCDLREGRMTALCGLFERRRASFRVASTLGVPPSEVAVAAVPTEFSLRISGGLVLAVVDGFMLRRKNDFE